MLYDLIIIGGGVNGCGILRDAALRGYKAILIEKNDFGAGTTGSSSQMIHGGARYLLNSLKTTKTSSLDSGYIQKIAPHLLFRIPFIAPIVKQEGKPTWYSKMHLELLDAFFAAYDRYVPLKNGKKHTRLSKEEALQAEPGLNPNLLGAVTFDEWGIDTFRLCMHNIIDAELHGSEALNHTEVIEVLQQGRRVVGLKVKDQLSGERRDLRGKLIVNAAGPWVPKVAQMAGCEVSLRPGKGIHVSMDRRLSDYAIMTNAIDGRSIFIMPYQNTSMIGTTDDDFFGDPDDVPILEDEVEYLMDGVAQVFPVVRQARVTHAWAGIRPTLPARGPYEDDLSRDHKIYDHEELDKVAGFLSIAGGKLASYRLMSEELIDTVAEKLGKKDDCRTHLLPLPGAERKVAATDLSKQFKLPLYTVSRLVYRYGGRAYEILEMTRSQPNYKNEICACDPVLEAELRFVIRNEKARTLEDLRRRTRLSLGPCQGTRCFMMGAQILGEELGLSPDQVFAEVKTSLQKRWSSKQHVLNGVGLQQEEMLAHTFYGVGNLDLI